MWTSHGEGDDKKPNCGGLNFETTGREPTKIGSLPRIDVGMTQIHTLNPKTNRKKKTRFV